MILERKHKTIPPHKIIASPPFIFVEDVGSLSDKNRTEEMDEQLLCFYDVLVRVPNHENFERLNSDQIASLINWDAEKYRQSRLK